MNVKFLKQLNLFYGIFAFIIWYFFNIQENFIEGEKSYLHSISVMDKYEVQNCLMKVRALQGLGWNLGCQGKSVEALR